MMNLKQRGQLHLVWISAVVIVIDQITKSMIVNHFTLYEVLPIMPFFNLTLAHNTGAAFSLLSQYDGWQNLLFKGIAIGISLVILIWLTRLKKEERWDGVALSFILGGALGNLIDRFTYGYVIDFLDVYVSNWHWPAFNIADSAIVIGASMLFLSFFRDRKSHDNAAK